MHRLSYADIEKTLDAFSLGIGGEERGKKWHRILRSATEAGQ